MKKFSVRIFFYFCLSFVFFALVSVCMPFFINIYSKFVLRKIHVSSYSFIFFKALCCSFISSPENAFNSGITTDCSFFSIKLIWLNLKADINLIAFGSDNLDYIITVIAISSATYIERLLPLMNLALSILYFLICGFVRSLMFVIPQFPLIFFIN